jgi:hypothetical protein
MSKHTKGPWTYEPSDSNLAGAITAKTGWICDFDTDPSPENACLIAAAPELLEALERIHKHAKGFFLLNHTGIEFNQWFEQAQKAIAKAKGEE